MSQTLHKLYELLGIKLICTSIYHLQLDGLTLHDLKSHNTGEFVSGARRQASLCNRGTRLHEFAPGGKELVLVPTSSSKLLANWQEPFEVIQQIRDIDYEVRGTDRGGVFHFCFTNS